MSDQERLARHLRRCVSGQKANRRVVATQGVTGWAQGRDSDGASGEARMRRKHQFDLYCVENNSLFLDLINLIETLSVVLFREGQ